MRVLIVLLVFMFSLAAQEKTSFHSYELIIQSDQKIQLSAWQIEMSYDKSKVKLTGIEGGEKPFTEPADYDARGLTGGKIILASFTLKKDESKKEFLVARVHVFGKRISIPKVKLIVAGNAKGQKLKAKVFLREVKKNE